MNSFSNTIYIISIFCISLVLASTLRTSKRIEKCSKTICPLVKATICVKVKDQNTPRRYVMMSKCELKLLKCYGDVTTTVVPGKYCNALRQGDLSPGKKEDPVNDSSSSKDSVNDSDPKDRVDQEDPVNDSDPKDPVDQKDPVNDYDPKERVDQEDPVNDSDPKDRVDQEDPVNDSGPKDRVDQEDPVNDSGPKDRVDQEDPVNDSSPKDRVNQEDPVNDSGLKDRVDQEENAHEPVNDEVPQVEGDNDGEKGNDQSGANCPQKCLNRRVMVCARCPHGIYRTFMSSCFMRMYQCQHPNEKLELVSRRACTGSAPYMGEMPKPSGEKAEPFDDDPVLNHIYHRLSVQD
ncbi:uncharacterized protein LOC134650764 [Cydia amplana]|uniref:uncharacterized protein LOC134650764 n=1 Tax=Cydia amplana TaxID=1869771 RepID=UPI002FE62811